MALSRLVAFDAALRTAGIPVDGLSVSASPPSAATVTINYLPSATQEQRDAGAQMLELFDWRSRRDLTRPQIVAGIAALTTAQQNAILRHLLALLIRTNAQEVAAILGETGLPLAVDEVVPT